VLQTIMTVYVNVDSLLVESFLLKLAVRKIEHLEAVSVATWLSFLHAKENCVIAPKALARCQAAVGVRVMPLETTQCHRSHGPSLAIAFSKASCGVLTYRFLPAILRHARCSSRKQNVSEINTVAGISRI